MSAKVLAYNIRQDVVDRTASAVMSANSGMFDSTSEVPTYLYTSLKTLWVGGSLSSSVYGDRVVADLGTGEISPAGSIVVIRQSILPSYLDAQGLKSDQVGSETAIMQLVLQRPRGATSTDLMQDMFNRLNYVLDYHERQYRGLPGGLTIADDNNVLKENAGGYYRCFFDHSLQEVHASQWYLLYRVEYLRPYGR